MVEPSEQFKKTLKQHGFSLTRTRRTVFEALQDKVPQTMQQLIAACPGVDRASVYRTVSLFERLDIIRRLQIGWKYQLELSDAYQHHHHHLTCNRCGQVIALPEDRDLEARLYGLARQFDFAMQDHQLEIQGLCPACRPA